VRWLLVALLVSSLGRADEAGARRHYLAGQGAYAAGHFAVALGEFTAGYALSPRPEFLYNIALAYRNLGRPADAIDNLKRFLAAAPESPHAGPARTLLQTLEPSPEPAAVDPSPPPARVEIVAPPPPLPARAKSRAWVWGGVVGAAAVVGLSVGLGVGLAPAREVYPSTPLPPLRFDQ
jgi:tetratricopeptide (TPR) repeat protein